MATNIYRVTYGYFDSNKKLVAREEYVDVLAADQKEATLKAVFASNGYTRNGKTLEIMSVRNVGPSGGDNGGLVIS